MVRYIVGVTIGLIAISVMAADTNVSGIVKEVDVKGGKITMTMRSEKREDKVYTLAKDVKVIVNGKEGKLEDVKAASRATLKVNEQMMVTEINVRSAERPKTENEPEKKPGDPVMTPAEQRRAEYAERQKFTFKRMKTQGKEAIEAASKKTSMAASVS